MGKTVNRQRQDGRNTNNRNSKINHVGNSEPKAKWEEDSFKDIC